MAARIDISAFRSSIPAEIAKAADALRFDHLESVGGGARAVVTDDGATFRPWVGVVDRTFTADCDCADELTDDGFCAHAVAVATAAFEAPIRFSGEGTPHGADPTEPDYLEAARSLDQGQLTALVADHAARDRLFATTLLDRAGLLEPDDESALADFESVLHDAANSTSGSRWEIADVESAGHRLAAEATVLAARPATPTTLDLLEQAIIRWDDLSGHLIDAYEVRRTDPEEISDLLIAAHITVCKRLNLTPTETTTRMTYLLDHCANETVDPAPYTALLQ